MLLFWPVQSFFLALELELRSQLQLPVLALMHLLRLNLLGLIASIARKYHSLKPYWSVVSPKTVCNYLDYFSSLGRAFQLNLWIYFLGSRISITLIVKLKHNPSSVLWFTRLWMSRSMDAGIRQPKAWASIKSNQFLSVSPRLTHALPLNIRRTRTEPSLIYPTKKCPKHLSFR